MNSQQKVYNVEHVRYSKCYKHLVKWIDGRTYQMEKKNVKRKGEEKILVSRVLVEVLIKSAR